MAHNIQDVLEHHEGDTARLDISVTVDGTVQPLNGASAEWFLLEDDSTDDISEESALVYKTGQEGGDEDEIEFVDPPDGDLVVKIEAEDTAGLVNWEEVDPNVNGRKSVEYDHRLRVTSGDGERTTQFVGTFEIWK